MRLFWLCIILVQLVGCRGCTPQKKPDETPEQAEIRRKKQRLVADELRALPYAQDMPGNFVKPGHWYQANHKLKANYGDESLTVTLTVNNRDNKAVPFAKNQLPIEFQRNLSLGLGQEKNIQLKYFQPEVGMTTSEDSDKETAAAKLVALYSQRGIGSPVLEEAFPNKLLSGYQYNLVSISRDPSRYTFWRGLDCIIWPSRAKMAEERIAPHRVIDLKEDEVAIQFPNRLYAMTSISHVVVNDASLTSLSTEQQQALLDWLHFGGTIILNGPEALGGIETSFIKEFAPLRNTSDVEFSQKDIELLNSGWTIKQALGDRKPFALDKVLTRLTGELQEGSRWVRFLRPDNSESELEGILAERMVGQGRVVMTTFSMAENAFLSWPSYDSFIHNTVLRKPRRDTSTGLEADTTYFGEYNASEQNPLHTTRLRLWARDLDATTARSGKEELGQPNFALPFQNGKRSSVGAWNPDSTIAAHARQALQESSGIAVPKINTIIKLLLGYLVVLVPVNWLVFRLMGRVELAWAAAPFIAIVGALVVARTVQLDVGFSRSQTSFGFLECHRDYSRGVLSKYSALYSSLSTNYRTLYEKDSGIVLPMAVGGSGASVRKPRGNLRKVDYTYADESGSGLRSTPVLSNTTGLFQSEETIDLGGSIRAEFAGDFASIKVTSDLGFPLSDAGIIGVDSLGKLRTGWLGTLENGAVAEIQLELMQEDNRWRAEWDRKTFLEKPLLIRADDTKWTETDLGNDLYLGPMLEEVSTKYPLGPGEFIALGWTESQLGDLSISPEAKQKRERTVVLAHLRCADLQAAQPDIRIFPKQDREPEQ
jgi:hypothetical protein